MRKISILSIIIALYANGHITSPAESSEIQLEYIVYDQSKKVSDSIDTVIQIDIDNDNRYEEELFSPNRKDLPEIPPNQLFSKVLIEPRSSEINQKTSPFILLIPYYKMNEDIFDIKIIAITQETPSQDEVNWLRSRDPNQMKNDGQIFEYFLRAFIQSRWVLDVKDVQKSPVRSHVNAVYSFLQSVKEIRRHYFIKSQIPIAIRARNWLSRTIESHPNVVENSVRIVNARQMIRQFDRIELDFTQDIWDNIIDTRQYNFEQYCSLSVRFYRYLQNMQSNFRAEIQRERQMTGYVASGISQCFAKAINNDIILQGMYGEGASLSHELNTHIQRLRLELRKLDRRIDTTKDVTGLRLFLNSDIQTLSDFANYLKTQHAQNSES